MTIRNALLTVTTASATFTTVFAHVDLAAAKSNARSLADSGLTVSLKVTDQEPGNIDAQFAIVTALAAIARSPFSGDKAVEYRLMRNCYGEQIVWILMQSANAQTTHGYGSKRGYLLAWTPSSELLQTISAAPLAGLYMWGFARCRTYEPSDCAKNVGAWTRF